MDIDDLRGRVERLVQLRAQVARAQQQAETPRLTGRLSSLQLQRDVTGLRNDVASLNRQLDRRGVALTALRDRVCAIDRLSTVVANSARCVHVQPRPSFL